MMAMSVPFLCFYSSHSSQGTEQRDLVSRYFSCVLLFSVPFRLCATQSLFSRLFVPLTQAAKITKETAQNHSCSLSRTPPLILHCACQNTTTGSRLRLSKKLISCFFLWAALP
jgi:hypothetical protein